MGPFDWFMLTLIVGLAVAAYIMKRRGIPFKVLLGHKPTEKKMVKLPVKKTRKPRKKK